MKSSTQPVYLHPHKGVDIPDCKQIVLFLCQNKYCKGPASETQSSEPQEMIVNNQLSFGITWINKKLAKKPDNSK